jgi:hypothetical protein
MSDTSLARTITKELGGDWHGRNGLAPAPGHSKSDRSLSIKPHPTDPDDVLLHSFAGEDWRAIKREWRETGLLPSRFGGKKRDSASRPARATKPETTAKSDLWYSPASWLWNNSEPADSTVVATYLATRGITLANLPATIRYLPPTPPKYPWPAMIAAYGLPDEPIPGELYLARERIKGVHLTYLQLDGSGKAPVDPQRRMIGASNGWPTVLASPNDGLSLLIGEGIETALSGHVLGMGIWSATSAGRMAALASKVPAHIEAVTIAVEADDAALKSP